ncbi:MAG: hypothetical protein QOD62_2648, partial [Actinomycetota bacterium]|nr:hypothetical protein [Actinomycetota bacterium]
DRSARSIINKGIWIGTQSGNMINGYNRKIKGFGDDEE